MAKEKFERVKPHLNQTVLRLQKMGISSVGARQVISGQPVTNSRDRLQLAKLLSATSMTNNVFDKSSRNVFDKSS